MKYLPLIFFSLTMAGCDQSDPVAAEANDTASLPAPANANVSNPTGAPPPANSSAEADPGAGTSPAAAAIPAFLHGRWGLTPGDCTSTRGDNKGLLTVSASELRFYESRAVPVAHVNSSADSFSAEYAFTGEGMSWKKYQTLELQDDKLVRTESNPTTSYTYARCG
ncbi:MAG TPA: hypothetical protein VFK50_12165 [Sphingomicrobium sp.]|nr:hypothetical protein [Sphingomicrobium sp.]